jgi:hypothetical protein
MNIDEEINEYKRKLQELQKLDYLQSLKEIYEDRVAIKIRHQQNSPTKGWWDRFFCSPEED